MPARIEDAALNQLLAALPPAELGPWLGRLEPVSLREGEVLHPMGAASSFAYFPIDAVVSLLVPAREGRFEEVCVVGREGMVGVAMFVDAGASTISAVVQSGGRALRAGREWILEECADSPAAMLILLRYTMARTAELAQGIVCSRHHTLAQRLSRRLLQAADCLGRSDIRMSQAQLAGLLGVGPSAVQREMRALRDSGAIAQAGRRVTLVDRALVECSSCECYRLVTRVYQRLSTELPGGAAPRARPAVSWATHLSRIREQERGDLARELHDELGSLLTRAKFDLAGLQLRLEHRCAEVDRRMTHLGEMLNKGIAFSRRVVDGLHPPTLASLGLAASVERLARDFGKAAGLRIQLALGDVEKPAADGVRAIPDAQTQLAVYRVVQESLNNITKHSAARQVGISIRRRGSRLVLTVRDDGCGFEPDAAGPGSHGLASMRHRVQACGGLFRVRSRSGAGTVVIAVFPAPAAPAAIPHSGAAQQSDGGPQAAPRIESRAHAAPQVP